MALVAVACGDEGEGTASTDVPAGEIREDTSPSADGVTDAPDAAETIDTAANDDADAASEADVPDGGACLTAQDCEGFIAEDKIGPCRRLSCVDNRCLLVADNHGQACDDDDRCTTDDVCEGGVCRGVANQACDDGDECTSDSCDPIAGCVFAPRSDAPCDDGDLCTDADTCTDGVCAGTPRDCNADGNPCAEGVCNQVTGACDITLLTGATCDDHNACTRGDVCKASGACSGEAVVCDDSDGCTIDWCDSASGCRHTDKCDDRDPCTADSCDPLTLACTHVPLEDGDVCDDGFDCTDNDSCTDSICSGTPVECDAGLVCELGACVDELVAIPGGSFWMGCNEAVDGACAAHEKPQHQVTLDPYLIGRFEVTEQQYQACVDAGKCSPNPNITGNRCSLNQPDKEVPNWRLHPASCLTWFQAQTYCEEMLPGGRLPTEAEWEKAARGGCELYPAGECAESTPKYPWGNAPFTCEHGIYLPSSCPGLGLWPVGSRPLGMSPYGLHDMAGNAGEWVSDWYGENYYLQSPAENPTGPPGGTWRVQKGGRYNSFEGYFLRASLRIKSAATLNGYGVGFRCVQPLPAP